MTPEKHKEADILKQKIDRVQIDLNRIHSHLKELFPPPRDKKILSFKIGEEDISIEVLPPVFAMVYDNRSWRNSEYIKPNQEIEVPRDLLEPVLHEMKNRLLLKLISLKLDYVEL